jgi:hypothetical protein
MTAPFTDLGPLAGHLRSLAGAHRPIGLDETILPTTTAGELAAAFGLADGARLTLNGVAAGDIADPAGNALTISTGAATLLAQAGVPVTLTFSIDGGALQVVVVATMPAGWTFASSFPGLTVFPFDRLTVSDARFVYATVAQPGFTWAGDPSGTMDLSYGQNLLCRLGLGGVPLIAGLLGGLLGQDDTVRGWGPFAPAAGQQLPVGTLTAPIDGAGFSIGSGAHALSLTDPRVVVRIGAAGDDTDPLQPVDLLVLGTFQQALPVAVAIPMAGDLYTVSTPPLPCANAVSGLVESLPGGTDFAGYLPAEVGSLFSPVGLDTFRMSFDTSPAVRYLGLAISTPRPWPLITGVLELDRLSLIVEVVDPPGLNWTSAEIAAQARFLPHIFADGDFDFAVSLDKQTSWQVGTASGSYPGAVNLGDLVAGLLGSQDPVPPVLRGACFADFGIVATRPAAEAPFDYTCYGSAQVALPLLDNEFTAHLTVVFTRTSTGYAVRLAGALAIGAEVFNLSLDVGTASALLSATWISTGDPLEFAGIAAAFGWTDVPALPGGPDLALTGASLSYDFTAAALVLTTRSKEYGQFDFASSGQNPRQAYLLELTVPPNIELPDILVASPRIPPLTDVRL